MIQTSRAITFQKTADGIWTNSETGVRIVRRGNGYRAFRPSVTPGYIGICQEVRTLADARREGRRYIAGRLRHWMRVAHDEALAEHAVRTIKVVNES